MARRSLKAVFGGVLRNERKGRGMSQVELARRARVDRTFLSQIERGVRQPTIATVWKLAGALGMAPAALVGKVERATGFSARA